MFVSFYYIIQLSTNIYVRRTNPSSGVNADSSAYAITIHSSQGSQFEHTIVAIDSASYIMGNVEILYTGITRAQKHCYLVAEPSIISKCLKTVENQQKQTYLCKILDSFSNPS